MKRRIDIHIKSSKNWIGRCGKHVDSCDMSKKWVTFTNCFPCFNYIRDMKSAFNFKLIFHVPYWNINPKWFPKFSVFLTVSSSVTEARSFQNLRLLFSSYYPYLKVNLSKDMMCLSHFNWNLSMRQLYFRQRESLAFSFLKDLSWSSNIQCKSITFLPLVFLIKIDKLNSDYHLFLFIFLRWVWAG